MHNFLLLGGDLRQHYLSRILTEHGFETISRYDDADSSFSMKKAFKSSSVILCPIPFTKDKINLFSVNEMKDLGIGNLLSLLTPGHILFGGNIPSYVKEYVRVNDILFYDYMELEDVTMKNTISTAEGALAEAIKKSPGCIHASQCLITGFGRCGKTLALKLKGLDANVTISDRKETQLSLAHSMGFCTRALGNLERDIGKYDFVFNTIPAPILEKELIRSMNPEVTIIDIASAPGGTDFVSCMEFNIRASLCLGLPGIYAPQASAQILFEAIIKCLS